MATQPNQDANDAEKMVRDYQMLQEQLRATAMQLDQLQNQKAELAKAKDEITDSSGKVYISVGGILAETTKDKALSDVKEKTELTEVRITSFTKQFNELKTKEKQLSEKLNQMYKQSRSGSDA